MSKNVWMKTTKTSKFAQLMGHRRKLDKRIFSIDILLLNKWKTENRIYYYEYLELITMFFMRCVWKREIKSIQN